MSRLDDILQAEDMLDRAVSRDHDDLVAAPVPEGVEEVVKRVAELRGLTPDVLVREHVLLGLRRDLGALFAATEGVPRNTIFDGSLGAQLQLVQAALGGLPPGQREPAEVALRVIYAWLEIQGARLIQLHASLRVEERGGPQG